MPLINTSKGILTYRKSCDMGPTALLPPHEGVRAEDFYCPRPALNPWTLDGKHTNH
jgi:hypothetical protein